LKKAAGPPVAPEKMIKALMMRVKLTATCCSSWFSVVSQGRGSVKDHTIVATTNINSDMPIILLRRGALLKIIHVVVKNSTE
jgi:hypothetical protein